MINNNQMISDDAEILKEIFLLPSQEVITERFAESHEAPCSGRCSSGICRMVI